MTNERAQRLVDGVEQRLVSDSIMPARISGTIALCSTTIYFVPGIWFVGVGLAGFCGTFALIQSLIARDVQKELKAHRAPTVWGHLMGFDLFGARLQASSVDLKNAIASLYEQDPNAQTLPLPQAVRLLDAHVHQQKRLEIISYPLNELQRLRRAMHEKLARLRDLGEDAPEAKRRLTELERDEVALRGIHNQTSASCARLESIFTSVQHAHQVRQLKRELGELSQAAGSSSELALESDAFDIERQIGREIETFLRLERETDEHLRDV